MKRNKNFKKRDTIKWANLESNCGGNARLKFTGFAKLLGT